MLPGVVLFALGLAMTVAPLTAAVLGAVEAGHSGVASAVNNAVARVAGLVAIAAVGAAVASAFAADVDTSLDRPAAPAGAARRDRHGEHEDARDRRRGVPAVTSRRARTALVAASVDGFHVAIAISAALALASGLVSLAGIANGRRAVAAESAPAGRSCGASADVADVELTAPV